MPWTAAEWLTELGGVARYGSLTRLVGRRELAAAVDAGLVVRGARGVYALPGVDDALCVAAALGGVLSLTSAALRHGWAVRAVPDKPHVTVPRGRKLGDRAALAHVHWGELGPHDIVDGATSPAVTLLQCLRSLPEPDALAVADSALREDGCHQLLRQVADSARGPGAPRVRRVAAGANGLAANPFESGLRSVCDTVPGLQVEPQVTIGDGPFRARPDLVDRRLRIILEADSFAWHGDRAALVRDAQRYNQMVVAGWLVLRFAYEDVRYHPDVVRDVLIRAVALAELLVKVGPNPWRAA